MMRQKHPENVGSYFGYIDECQYLSGIVAGHKTKTKVIGFVAMALATANVVGGWFVTDRMLEMFKKRPEPKKESTD